MESVKFTRFKNQNGASMKKKLALLLALAMVLSMLPMNVFGISEVLNNQSGFAGPTETQPVNAYNLWVDVMAHRAYASITTSDQSIGRPIITPDAEYPGQTGLAAPTPYSANIIAIPLQLANAHWAAPRTRISPNISIANNTTAQNSIGFLNWTGSGDAWRQDPAWLLSSRSTAELNRRLTASHYSTTTTVKAYNTSRSQNASVNDIHYRLDVQSRDLAILYIYTPTDDFITPGVTNGLGTATNQWQWAEIPMFIQPTGDNPAVTIGTQLNDVRPIASHNFTREFTVDSQSTGTFSNFAYFQGIRINENVRGKLSVGTHYFYFMAPDHYRWTALGGLATFNTATSVTRIDRITNDIDRGYRTRFDNTTNLTIAGSSDDTSYAIMPNSSGRILRVALSVSASQNTATPEVINLKGLGLIADDRAPNSDVTIQWNYSSTNVMSAGLSDPWGVWRWSGQERGSFVVATRGFSDVLFGLRDGETAPNLRSGDSWRTTTPQTRQWTAWMRLTEASANAWSGTLGVDATFNVPEGISINRADVHIKGGANFADIERNDRDVQPVIGDQFADDWGILVTPRYVRVTPALQNMAADRWSSRYVDIRLDLAIEPGYEWKYPDGEIEVTVTGGSVSHLAGSPTVVAAYAKDPITLDVEPIEISVSDAATYNVARYEIGDITITETDFARLQRGEDLWVYVIGARASEVEFSCDLNAIVNTEDSGLELEVGRIITPWGSNLIHGVSFTIKQQSRDQNNRYTEPGVITITGGVITGPVYPGVNYEVVVSGSAVAGTNYTVAASRYTTTTAQNERWRFFDAEPYRADAFSYDSATSAAPPSDTAAPPAAAPPAVIITDTLNLNVAMQTMFGVDHPYIKQTIPGTNTGYGAVSARVFGRFLGMSDDEIQASYSEANRTFTLVGSNKSGETVTVELTQDSPNAVINGNTVDIAEFSGYAAGYRGTVQVVTVNARTYLPLRFLANAFEKGVTSTDGGDSVIISH